MTDEDAFLRAVIADPEDDAPRLIYADWLDEHGQSARAELIRLQCARARWPDDDSYPAQLMEREAHLLLAYARDWGAPVSGLTLSYHFGRGFIEHVMCDMLTFLEHYDELFRVAPVRHLALRNAGRAHLRLGKCPHLSRLLTLDLSYNRLRDEGPAYLATSPYLKGLIALDLTRARVGDEGARALARSPYLRSLESLCLRENPITEQGRSLLRQRFGERVQF
jgi:uncharacterized protein (TIGR02996 family)